MHVIDAAHSVVHDYPGGASSLAPRMGMSANILRNKVLASNKTHHLTLVEAMRLVALTSDQRLIHAIALEAGGIFLDASEEEDLVCDMAVLESVTAVFSGAGTLGGAVHSSLADGDLTSKEFKSIERAAYQLRLKAVRLVKRMCALKEPDRG